MLNLKGSGQQVNILNTWMDTSQHPSGIRSAALFSLPISSPRLIRHWGWELLMGIMITQPGLLHCSCVKHLWLWITKGNPLKDQNGKQKEPVLKPLTNPRTSYRLFDRIREKKKKKEREIWVLKKEWTSSFGEGDWGDLGNRGGEWEAWP